jgi:hypothetical protein
MDEKKDNETQAELASSADTDPVSDEQKADQVSAEENQDDTEDDNAGKDPSEQQPNAMQGLFIRMILVFLTVFLCNSCSGPKRTLEEENALAALTHIQQGIEANVAYEQYIELLNQAKIKIDILKIANKSNLCFMRAIEKCYASYNIAGKAWKKKMEATDKACRADMDLTMSFSISFGAVSIQKADNCFNKKYQL